MNAALALAYLALSLGTLGASAEVIVRSGSPKWYARALRGAAVAAFAVALMRVFRADPDPAPEAVAGATVELAILLAVAWRQRVRQRERGVRRGGRSGALDDPQARRVLRESAADF